LSAREAVVLLHGMGRSWVSMALLGHRLSRHGYEVHLFGYSPRRPTLDQLSLELQRFIEERVEAETYHLIGHSLGNIIVRNGFRFRYRPSLSRIVMLAPPNGPAALASSLRENRLYRWWTGDSGQKLGDVEFYRTLPVPTVAFGVIAGDRGHRLGFEEPNDGVVRVENTRLDGMRDWLVLHHTHTFIMLSADTADHCLRFLRGGRFQELERGTTGPEFVSSASGRQRPD
jgi:triacylglycerol lipase